METILNNSPVDVTMTGKYFSIFPLNFDQKEILTNKKNVFSIFNLFFCWKISIFRKKIFLLKMKIDSFFWIVCLEFD